MQIKEKFTAMLDYVVGKQGAEKKDAHYGDAAVDFLARETAVRIVDSLEDDSPRDIMDFLYSLEELSEAGEYQVIVEIITMLLDLNSQDGISVLIRGFISERQLNAQFISELVDAGSDYCFFKSIGLE